MNSKINEKLFSLQLQEYQVDSYDAYEVILNMPEWDWWRHYIYTNRFGFGALNFKLSVLNVKLLSHQKHPQAQSETKHFGANL